MLATVRELQDFLLFWVENWWCKAVKHIEKKPLKITNFFDCTENEKQNIYLQRPQYDDLKIIYIINVWSITDAVR